MAPKPKSFVTEAAMCARFIAGMGDGWTAYPETSGWDILLVRKEDGFQIGIEAKLRMGTDVINQALEEYGVNDVDRMGPDCRAVMVPSDAQGGFDRICAYIGITIIRVYDAETAKRYYRKDSIFEPTLPEPNEDPRSNWNRWYEWAPTHRHRLPDYVPDVVAGAPSPVQLTDWKIRAIKISIILEKRGFVVRADFKHVGIDHRRWLPSGAGWLTIEGGRYTAGRYIPHFKRQHPRVYEEIAAAYDEWKPADPLILSLEQKQEGTL